jgi:protoporphyrinogen oxidase
MANIGIIGGGYAGLSAAHELAIRNGHTVTIHEASAEIGGLAGAFELSPGIRVEKFYHHWFTSDKSIFQLINELGLQDSLSFKSSRNGLFYANSVFRLSTPWELLSFTPLPLVDRVRTGLMALYARSIQDWISLEDITAREWIESVGGKKAYAAIWQPLLRGKFGSEADNISAVWFWNKLKLRGGSRSKDGRESLAYYNGGFGALTDAISDKLIEQGVDIKLNSPVSELIIEKNQNNGKQSCTGLKVGNDTFFYDAVLATLPLPEFLKLSDKFPQNYSKLYNQVRFLGNTCLVLTLNQSLSETYWLNVADPSFPFVGIIEHTNFDNIENYGGKHIAYLSKYLTVDDPLFALDANSFLEYCIPFIKKIFPDFNRDIVHSAHVWKARYSQPVIVKHYSKLIPPTKGPFENLWLSTMSQVYPEDRGTNYAVEHGRNVAKDIAQTLLPR